MHFKDKVIWITGASSGIGAELALQLSRQQAKLILTARTTDKLKGVQQACRQHTAHCTILEADVTEFADSETLTQNAISIYGQIDVVIHAAGVSQRSLGVDTTFNVYQRLMDINFLSIASVNQYLLPHFAKRNTGHIVAIGSMAGLMGFPMRSGYAAAKHALNGYLETLQTEQTIAGLKITNVSAGRINTELSKSALLGNGDAYSKTDRDLQNGIAVDKCAAKIIDAMQKARKHVIIAKKERLLYWIWWFLPSLYYKIANAKGIKNIQP